MAAVVAGRRHKVLSFVATLRTWVWRTLRDWFQVEKAVQYLPIQPVVSVFASGLNRLALDLVTRLNLLLFTYCAPESAESPLLPCV